MGRRTRVCQGWQKTPPTLIASLAYVLLLAGLQAWAVDTQDSLPGLEPAGIALSALSPKRTAVTPDDYTVVPIPDWVRPAPAFNPSGHPGLDPVTEGVLQPGPGYRARLQDFQFNGLVPHRSSHFNAAEYVLTSQSGVEKYSIITIPYESAYERLNLHELWIKRGEALIDKLPEARFDILHAGPDRADQLHPGTRTLVISLDDIRIGDRLRYSFSREGENPVFQGHRELSIHTEHLSPLDRQYTRVLTSSDKALNRRVRGRDVPLQISDSDGVQEIVIDQQGVREYSPEEDVPSWRIDRGTIVFSDMQNWHSVVDWALPMYRLSEYSDPEILTIASVIQTTHQDPAERIGVALRWVQDEIGTLYAASDTESPLTDTNAQAEVDIGIHPRWSSHRPSRPAETLNRRVGDGKDKALLLIALLRELGVDAQPALVNTRRGLESDSYPLRLHAFNRRLSVTLRYQSLADEVTAEDIDAYAAAIQSIRDMASFRIRDKPPMAGVPGRVLNHLWQGWHAGAGWLWFAFARP